MLDIVEDQAVDLVGTERFVAAVADENAVAEEEDSD